MERDLDGDIFAAVNGEDPLDWESIRSLDDLDTSEPPRRSWKPGEREAMLTKVILT